MKKHHYELQYRMPDAYDQDGGVNQEKRFSVAQQRYRSVAIKLYQIVTMRTCTHAHLCPDCQCVL